MAKNKTHVYKTYDIIADWYDKHRSRGLFEKPYLDLAISNLPANGTILDVGCGTGEPIARYFVEKGFQVTGIEASKKLIEKAKSNVPNMNIIECDMRDIHLKEKFNCIIAWHSFFHLTKEDQEAMFAIFEKHIADNGILMFTSGPDEGEVWSDNGGQMLYHASLSERRYRELLHQYHFKVIKYKAVDKECRDATVWVARQVRNK